MPNQPPLIKAENIGRFIRQRWLWREVSFELMPGETLGLVGPSGIGKSLLMRSLTGLDPLDEGNVMVRGRSLSKWDPPMLRCDLLYLAQSPGLFEGTVEDNLKAIFQLKSHRDRQYSRDETLQLFHWMGRQETFLEQPTTRLSGGERQILSLVRGLLVHPTVLLLDEPTAALDMETTTQVEKVLQNWLQNDPSRAYIWISHSPEQIQRMTRTQLNLSDYTV